MKKEGLGYFYLIITIILFSTYEAVSKTLVGKIDPFQINFIRFFIGGIILFIFLLAKGDLSINRKDLAWVAVIGIINVVISMNLIQLSLYISDAKASIVAVIFSSNPIFVAIFAALINKERISLYKLIGLAIGVFGIGTIFFDKLGFGSMSYKSPLLALLSAIAYGLYTVLGRNVSVRIGSLKMNAYSFIIGSFVLLPFLFLFELPIVKFDLSGIYQVIYLSVLVTGLAYLAYFKGLSIIGASKGSLVFFIKPALASVIAVLFLSEKISLNLFLGTIFILLGISAVVYEDKLKGKFGRT